MPKRFPIEKKRISKSERKKKGCLPRDYTGMKTENGKRKKSCNCKEETFVLKHKRIVYE